MIPLPPFCAVAFKEWSAVCDAIGSGRQSIILRKGGIAEENGQFRPEHEVFWLYPTELHQTQQGLKEGEAQPGSAGPVALSVLVRVEWHAFLDREEQLARLAGLHVWSEETVKKRFQYKQPGLWLMAVRAWTRDEAWPLEVRPEYAGCKSWVMLDEPLATEDCWPALTDDEAEARLDALRPKIEG